MFSRIQAHPKKTQTMRRTTSFTPVASSSEEPFLGTTMMIGVAIISIVFFLFAVHSVPEGHVAVYFLGGALQQMILFFLWISNSVFNIFFAFGDKLIPCIIDSFIFHDICFFFDNSVFGLISIVIFFRCSTLREIWNSKLWRIWNLKRLV